MSKPIYVENLIQESDSITIFERLLDLNWLSVTEARKEYFMSEVPRSYIYGTSPHEREYQSENYSEDVLRIQRWLNFLYYCDFNVCFLNRYDSQKNQLGWHADDSPSMDRKHPIAVVSFGAEREIWWKRQGETGIVPPEQRQKLGNGSLFMMPSGFQDTHFHRIPRADRVVGTRISLTFRKYV